MSARTTLPSTPATQIVSYPYSQLLCCVGGQKLVYGKFSNQTYLRKYTIRTCKCYVFCAKCNNDTRMIPGSFINDQFANQVCHHRCSWRRSFVVKWNLGEEAYLSVSCKSINHFSFPTWLCWDSTCSHYMSHPKRPHAGDIRLLHPRAHANMWAAGLYGMAEKC